MLGSNVPVIFSFLFIATRGHSWPNLAGPNMRPTMPNMRPIATVADVLAVSRSLSHEPVMEDKPKSANPNRLTPEDLATLLSNRRKKRVEVEHIQADIEAGAPTNADGTISVVAYAAWLLQEKHRGD